MLLAIDVGNTNTVLGVFGEKELEAHWRLSTLSERTADELGANLVVIGNSARSGLSAAVNSNTPCAKR